MNDAPGRTLFFRTRPGPTSAWHTRLVDDSLSGAERLRSRDGYNLLAVMATEADRLPSACEANRPVYVNDYIAVRETPRTLPDGTRLWEGMIEVGLSDARYPPDPALTGLLRVEFESSNERYRTRGEAGTPARFLERPDGTITVEQEITLRDGKVLEFRGERVSTTTISCPG